MRIPSETVEGACPQTWCAPYEAGVGAGAGSDAASNLPGGFAAPREWQNKCCEGKGMVEARMAQAVE